MYRYVEWHTSTYSQKIYKNYEKKERKNCLPRVSLALGHQGQLSEPLRYELQEICNATGAQYTLWNMIPRFAKHSTNCLPPSTWQVDVSSVNPSLIWIRFTARKIYCRSSKVCSLISLQHRLASVVQLREATSVMCTFERTPTAMHLSVQQSSSTSCHSTMVVPEQSKQRDGSSWHAADSPMYSRTVDTDGDTKIDTGPRRSYSAQQWSKTQSSQNYNKIQKCDITPVKSNKL